MNQFGKKWKTATSWEKFKIVMDLSFGRVIDDLSWFWRRVKAWLAKVWEWWGSWDIEDVLKSQAILVAEAEGKREEEKFPLSVQEALNKALRDSANLRIQIEEYEGRIRAGDAESSRLGFLAGNLQTQVRELHQALAGEQTAKSALVLELEELRAAKARRSHSQRQKPTK